MVIRAFPDLALAAAWIQKLLVCDSTTIAGIEEDLEEVEAYRERRTEKRELKKDAGTVSP
jgi:hypothetical protein